MNATKKTRFKKRFQGSSRNNKKTRTKKRFQGSSRNNKKTRNIYIKGRVKHTNVKGGNDPEDPVIGEPVIGEPVIGEPVIEERVIEVPIIEEPTTENLAATKIQRFMKQNKDQITSLFLKTICSDSGVCIAFGKESDKIKKFFNGFCDFNYLVDSRMIGEAGNGFVYELSYSREGYNAHTVLKSASWEDSDNLIYEYYIGMLINKHFNKRTPSFIETYCVYKYTNNEKWEKAKENRMEKREISSSIEKIPDTIQESCNNSKHICILIQHIKNSGTIYSISRKVSKFSQIHLLYVLYQVYFTLAIFGNHFTHYDLHEGNVLIFEPVKDKYIEYHYHISNNETVTFKSFYIAKIIDYGRSCFNILSENYINKLCKIKKCKQVCQQLEPYSRINVSEDLGLLYKFKDKCNEDAAYGYPNYLINVMNNINYTEGGQTENKTSGIQKITDGIITGKINNVTDAEVALRSLIKLDFYKDLNRNTYNGNAKLGDLHIYINKDMEFIPVK